MNSIFDDGGIEPRSVQPLSHRIPARAFAKAPPKTAEDARAAVVHQGKAPNNRLACGPTNEWRIRARAERHLAIVEYCDDWRTTAEIQQAHDVEIDAIRRDVATLHQAGKLERKSQKFGYLYRRADK